MATYQLRAADDTTLAQADLPSDTRAMAWMVAAATRNRRAIHGDEWSGYRLVDDAWERRFAGGGVSRKLAEPHRLLAR